MNGLFPEDSDARKTYPVYSGLLQYFPAALAAVAHHSYKGNEKHNPGQSLHHDRAKSGDEPDALVRHLMEGDYVGMAWRALSMLQKDCEANGALIAPAARNANLAEDFAARVAANRLATGEVYATDGSGNTAAPPSDAAEAAARLLAWRESDDEPDLRNGEAVA